MTRRRSAAAAAASGTSHYLHDVARVLMIRRPSAEIMSTFVRLSRAAASRCAAALIVSVAATAAAQQPTAPEPDTLNDPVRMMVARLDLEKYKATIKGLTQFGDRRQGTDRNRAAVDWIEAQLKSYGCPTERITYDYHAAAAARPARAARRAAAARGARRVGAQGGARMRGIRAPTGVNTDSLKQPDAKLRALNTQPTTPGERAGGLLHEGRHHASRGDVHRRRPHGRPSAGARRRTTTARAPRS